MNPDALKLNDWAGFLSFKKTPLYQEFLHRREKLIALFTGNQYGKTDTVAHSYVLRALNRHPVKEKNITPASTIRTFRFASQNLPTDSTSGEVKNTQYPALKRRLPSSLIVKDITVRRPVISIQPPEGGLIHFEFVSFNQDVQSQAGVQRASIWLDESAPEAFFEEQLPRLLAADGRNGNPLGDIVQTLTPAELMNWEFDRIFERAKVFIRTSEVQQRIKLRYGKEVPLIEETGSQDDIVVFQAATDNNPVLSIDTVNQLFEVYDDEDVVDIRRYGLFRQASGLMFKHFDLRVHKIDTLQFFKEGVPPREWLHARAIDYHEATPWACVFAAISPDDEVFIYDELNPSPEKFVTLEISSMLAEKSGDYRYPLNLIDPLAVKKQSNTGLSVLDDLNRIFYNYRREGRGTGGYWKSWDTKSTRGRDEIRKRLKNAVMVGKPFNNLVGGKRLPTLWITSNCKQLLLSMKHWRREEWASKDSLQTKDAKEAPQQKWSHFPMCLEALFKESSFKARTLGKLNYRNTMESYGQRA